MSWRLEEGLPTQPRTCLCHSLSCKLKSPEFDVNSYRPKGRGPRSRAFYRLHANRLVCQPSEGMFYAERGFSEVSQHNDGCGERPFLTSS